MFIQTMAVLLTSDIQRRHRVFGHLSSMHTGLARRTDDHVFGGWGVVQESLFIHYEVETQRQAGNRYPHVRVTVGPENGP